MKLSKKDLKILPYLRKNARERLTKISRKTGIPVSTIFDKLRTYQEELITKHVTIVNFDLIGFNSRANIILKVEKNQREELKNFIQQSKTINSAYRINNGYDFFIEAITKDMKQLENFVEEIEEKFNIKTKHVFYIVEDIKREEFLTTTSLDDSSL